MRVGPELVVFLITFLVWIIGQIAERERKKRAQQQQHPEAPTHPPGERSEGGLPDLLRLPWPPPDEPPPPPRPRRTAAPRDLPGDGSGEAARPAEPVQAPVFAAWRSLDAALATTAIGTVKSSLSEERRSRARTRLHLTTGTHDDREMLRRAVLLAEVLGAPRAVRAWTPPNDAL